MHPPPALAPQAMQRLLHYRFPGNVRELENLLHRALALSGSDRIEAEDLGLGDDDEAEATVAMALDDSPPAPDTSPTPLPTALQAHLDAVGRDVLLRALARHRFNRTAAGASLGLSLRQMRYRMARLGVDVDPRDPASERGENAD